ncbi:MAG TPA: hypothetical protein VM925_24730 [Labilithrix sp.]|nr:hypothetical protein [Labilithrix sp.]
MRCLKTFGSMLLLLSLAGAANAAPQLDSKRAAQSFAVGKSAFARGDFSAAAAAFEQAALYAPHPAPLLNAAEAWELAGNHVRAAQMCDRVLETKNIDAKYRDAAVQQLSRVVPRIATVDVKVPDGTRLNVEGERDDVVGRKIRLTPGAHKITATYRGGETRSENVSLPAGELKELDMMNPSPPPPPEPPAPEPPPEKKPATTSGPPAGAWIAFSIAAVTGGVATFYGLRTIDARDQFDAKPSIQTRDDFNSARLMTNVFVGVAAASAIVGVVLWIAAPGDPSKDRAQSAREALSGVVRF